MASHAKKYQSTIEAQQRRVTAYVHPKYHKLTIAYATMSDMRVSEVVSLAIKHYFDSMPAADRNLILQQHNLSKTATT